MRAARAVLPAVVAVLALLAAGPSMAVSPSATPVPASPVRGLVGDIFADPDPVVESITLRTDDGRELLFAIGDLAPSSFPPIHLFEHHAASEPILVSFDVAPDGALVATDLREAAGAWLDRPIPTDAAPGSTIAVGATLWDEIYERPPQVQERIVFRLSPARGDARPTEAFPTSDWEGHYTALLEVPAGGPGHLTVGVEIRTCDQTGHCDRYDSLFALAGVGPPPGIAPTDFATAAIDVSPASVVAGEPFDVEVVLTARADWDPDAFQMPNTLVVDVREARGPSIDTLDAALEDPAGGYYAASITLPAAGRYVLQVGAAAGDPFTTAVTTIEATAPLEPEDIAPGTLDLVPVVVAVAALGLLLVLGAVALRRAG